MADFKIEYSRYRHKQSLRKKEENRINERLESSYGHEELQQVVEGDIRESRNNVPEDGQNIKDMEFEANGSS